MAKLAIAGVAVALTLIPATAMAQMDSRIGAPPMLPQMDHAGMPVPNAMPHSMPRMGGPGPMPHMPPMAQPMGQPMNQSGPGGDRWSSVPGGWNAYRAPSYGYTLPSYWVAPSYYISDYRSFGLPSPASGYGWSRYYDDIVLTDRWGRVYDWRDGRDMRGDDGRDYRPRRRDRSGIVGALIGGAVGALTGNLIAGAGSRLAGSLIGGGVGALAGQAIDRSSSRGRGGYDERGGYDQRGGYEGGYRMNGPHWSAGDYNGGSYGGCGCGQTVTTTTTTYARPITTTRVTYVTEYVRVPAKHRVRVLRTKDRYLGGS